MFSRVDGFIARALAEREAREAAELHARNVSGAVARQLAVNEAEDALLLFLGAEVCELLGVGFTARDDGQRWSGYGFFADRGLVYRIERGVGSLWGVSCTTIPMRSDPERVKPEHLRQHLLEVIASARVRSAELKEAEIEAARTADAALTQRVAEERQHEEISAQIAKLIALGPSWTWPEGVAVAFHRVQWLTGAVRLSGSPAFDYDFGYCWDGHLSAEGYITLLPHSGATEQRTVRLLPEQHLPVFQNLVARSVQDLTPDLLEPEFATLAGVRCVRDVAHEFAPRYVRNGFETHTVCIGHVPVAWIREGCAWNS